MMVGAALLAACATTPPPAIGPPLGEGPTPPLAAEPAPPPRPTCTAFVRPGVLRRSSLVRAIGAGLGQWMADGVEVEPRHAQGRFQGWIVRRLYPDDPCYQQVDLQVGDVVTRANGKSIENPDQANEVFSSLRTAPSLVIDLVREGRPRTLTFPIADQ
jgi:S1-C subfamily serine protease